LRSAQEKALAFMGARVSRPDEVRGWGLGALHPALVIQRRARPCGSLPGKPNALGQPQCMQRHRALEGCRLQFITLLGGAAAVVSLTRPRFCAADRGTDMQCARAPG